MVRKPEDAYDVIARGRREGRMLAGLASLFTLTLGFYVMLIQGGDFESGEVIEFAWFTKTVSAWIAVLSLLGTGSLAAIGIYEGKKWVTLLAVPLCALGWLNWGTPWSLPVICVLLLYFKHKSIHKFTRRVIG